jgi:hypothetical protein
MLTKTRRKAPITGAKKLTVNRKDLIAYFPQGMVIAEIGVYRGGYAQHLVKCNPSELHLIDIWKRVEGDSVYATIDAYNKDDEKHAMNKRLVEKRMQPYPFTRIVQSDSVSAAATFTDGYFDAVYIDGDHSYQGCLNDLYAYASKVKNTGFMFGHDWTHTASWIEVQEAVIKFVEDNPEWSVSHVTAEAPTGHPSWILTRENSEITRIIDKLTITNNN